MKKHHDHSNSYKRKHLIGAGLQFRSLVHCHHGREYGGEHEGTAGSQDAGDTVESSISGSIGSGKKESLAWAFENFKAHLQ